MDSEITNALSNSALSMIGCGRDLGRALEMLLESLAIDLSNPPEIYKKVLHLRHYNTAFAYRALGNIEDARHHVEKASRCAEAEFGKHSRYLTITYRMYADFSIREGNYDKAYDYANQALAIAQKASATNPWVSAALYYLGNIRILQARAAEAIEQLKQALWITKLNEGAKSDAGESARVMNKLSQAYIANGDIKKGSDMRKDADTIYSDLIKTGEYTASDDPVLKWDYLVCLNFR
ncbi:hypothetical protein ACEPPN_000722 [Leptodophora sp. 'Broadleaf-Isolate-01']